jgi:hypothetical protein
MNFVEKPNKRVFAVGGSFILLALSLLGIILNAHSYFGMSNKTVETSKTIYSASPSKEMPFLLYQSVGTADKERVYIYKTDENQKKPSTTKPDIMVKNVVKTTSEASAFLVQVKKEKVYSSEAMKFIFGLAGNDHTVKEITNTFYLPKTWTTLSTAQAKKLESLGKDKDYQAKMKQEAQSFIGAKVQADMEEFGAQAKSGDMEAAQLLMDPAKLQEKQKELVEKYTKEFQAESMKKLIEEVKKAN